MKKLICVLILLMSTAAYSQFKSRETSEAYLGAGVGLNVFTNSDVSGMYPMFDIDNSSFLTNIAPYFGYKFNSTFSAEISPMVSIAKTYSKNGFYFTDQSGSTLFYKPQNLSLAMIPLLARVKIFPFASDLKASNLKAGWYSGAGAGITYLNESYDSFVYLDNNSYSPMYSQTNRKSYWTPVASVFTGWESSAKYAFGIEIGYNFIPAKVDRTDPLMISVASNFNNFYLNIKGRLGF
ncbi:MAG TPA: hypothetical protein PK447_08590 [Ignavibacteria bacterium]|nr:hypothetical protein [Ignavibacteria bacterium]